MKIIVKLICLLTVMLVLVMAPYAQPSDSRPTTIITVGVINYDDYQRTYVDAQQALTTLAEAYNKPEAHKANRVSFQLAVGSYDDVLDWYKKGHIHVAVLSPGPVSALLSSPQWGPRLRDLYIGTTIATRPKPDNSFADYERRHESNQVTYHSICVVNSDSPIKDLEDLKTSIAADKVAFLFVHPLSASGRILPEYVLHRIPGIDPEHLSLALSDAKFTYSHAASLKALEQSTSNDVLNVAFVWDQVGDDPVVRSKFRKIAIPELDQLSIPQEVILLGSRFKEKEQFVRDVFLYGQESTSRYRYYANWFDDYKNGMVQWMDHLEHKPDLTGKSYFGLQEVIDKVRSYESNHPGEARTRLALVLSGGGAKCAYQAGVIEAIESEISLSNSIASKNAEAAAATTSQVNGLETGKAPKPSPRPIDIDLVVGTSGGAINALAVASGVTIDEETNHDLANTWMDFKQSDFFRPWAPMPATLGLMVGAGQALLLILGLRLRDNEQIKWRRRTRPVVVALFLFAIVLFFSSWRSWSPLPLIAMLIVIGVQLYDNQAKDWRALTGASLIGFGLIEFVIAILNISPLNYARVGIPTLVFLALVFFLVLGARVLTLDGKRWLMIARIAIPILFVVDAVIMWIWRARLMALSKHHLILHLWMTLSMNLILSAIFLLVLGALMLVADRTIRYGWPLKDQLAADGSARGWVKSILGLLISDNARFFTRRKPLLDALTIGLVSLFALQLGRSFLLDKSLSQSAGVDHAFVEKLPHLLQHHPRGAINKPQGEDDRQRLADISQQILDRQLLRRDLIITNSLLNIDAEQPDRYFYYQVPTTGVPAPPAQDNDIRFRSFQEPGLAPSLLDVIIGSATIYPVFGPRNVIVSKQGASIDIIDGGFAHNSPIEAAVAWGAKFIILIEASPNPAPSQHRHLLDNSLDAFNFLFKEAQLTDVHSRGKIEIFQIQPDGDDSESDPNLCTFDFDRGLIKGVISKGRTDAITTSKPKFERTRGQPIF